MTMRRTTWVVLLAIALTACNTEKRRLTERLAALEERSVAASRRLLQQRRAIAESEEKLRALNVDLAIHNTETQTYIDKHRIAAGCIYAARVQFGEQNAFSDQVAKCSRIGTVLCSLALLNRTFAQEVRGVATMLAKADERVDELQQQIASLEKTIAAQRSERARVQDEADDLTAQMAGLRRELALE